MTHFARVSLPRCQPPPHCQVIFQRNQLESGASWSQVLRASDINNMWLWDPSPLGHTHTAHHSPHPLHTGSRHMSSEALHTGIHSPGMTSPTLLRGDLLPDPYDPAWGANCSRYTTRGVKSRDRANVWCRCSDSTAHNLPKGGANTSVHQQMSGKSKRGLPTQRDITHNRE